MDRNRKDLTDDLIDVGLSGLDVLGGTAGIPASLIIKTLKLLVKSVNYLSGRFEPTMFLRLTNNELLEKYSLEKLLSFRVGLTDITLPQSVLLNNSKERIKLKDLDVILDPVFPVYQFPSIIGSKAEELKLKQLKIRPKEDYESTTIRLNYIIESDNKISLHVSKAHYTDYLATNYSMDAKLDGWSNSLRDTIHKGGKLCELSTSPLANHIGIGILFFTCDGYLVLPTRSKDKVNISRGAISPSVSGATNFDEDMDTMINPLLNSIRRESMEELNIEAADIDLQSVKFLGLTRELLRGGKPEAFFVGNLHCTKRVTEEKFKAKPRDRENSKLDFFEFGTSLQKDIPVKSELSCEYNILFNRVKTFLDANSKRLSLPFITNFMLWLEYVRHYVQDRVEVE